MAKGSSNRLNACYRFVEKLESLNFTPVDIFDYNDRYDKDGNCIVEPRYYNDDTKTFSYFFNEYKTTRHFRNVDRIHFIFSKTQNRFICQYDPKTGIIYHPNFNTNQKRLSIESLMILYNNI